MSSHICFSKVENTVQLQQHWLSPLSTLTGLVTTKLWLSDPPWERGLGDKGLLPSAGLQHPERLWPAIALWPAIVLCFAKQFFQLWLNI